VDPESLAQQAPWSASLASMAPQKQRGIFVTTLESGKVDGFNNLELQETDVPRLKDGQVRRCFGPQMQTWPPDAANAR
jgi:hypothetical protein